MEMKVWQVALTLVLALGLAIGIVVPALAAPDKPGPPEVRLMENVLKGEIIELDDAQKFFIIESGDEVITVWVDGETKYYQVSFPARIAQMAKERLGAIMPHLKNAERQVPQPFAIQRALKFRAEVASKLHPFGEEAGYEDLYLGAKVVVRTAALAEEPLAKTVLIVEPKTHCQLKGIVSAISPQDGTLEVLPDDSRTEVELTFTDRTHFHLIGVTVVEVRQPVRVVYNEDLVARIVVVNPQME